MSTSEIEQVRPHLRRAKELDPGGTICNDFALRALGERLSAAWKSAKALAWPELAIELFPKEAPLYRAVADVHFGRARQWLSRGVEGDPTNGNPSAVHASWAS
ncbi:MAG: hypothetical protein ACUVWA_07365 [Candidatus Oleimicrobiaceae bacterium]